MVFYSQSLHLKKEQGLYQVGLGTFTQMFICDQNLILFDGSGYYQSYIYLTSYSLQNTVFYRSETARLVTLKHLILTVSVFVAQDCQILPLCCAIEEILRDLKFLMHLLWRTACIMHTFYSCFSPPKLLVI